jgi:hypothetical protein
MKKKNTKKHIAVQARNPYHGFSLVEQGDVMVSFSQ